MRRRLLALVLLAGVLASALGVPTATAAPQDARTGGIGIRLVDVPTAAADDPRARSYIVDHLKPGSSIERRVEVVNNGPTTRISVYPAAATITRGGFVGAPGRTPDDLSGWTSATPGAVVLKKDERRLVTVRIAVPADAVQGEKYGVVWAEMTTPPTTSGGITRVSRVGIRLYLSVGAGGAPPTDFEIVSLAGARSQDNVPMVQAAVHNTGGRALDLTGSLRLSHGPAGLAAGPFPVPVGTTVGVGETIPLMVPLDPQIPDGPWLATVNLTSGVTSRSAHATITFPSAPGVGPAVQSAPAHPWLWWLVGALVLVLLLGVALALRRRARRHASAGDPDPAPMGDHPTPPLEESQDE